jgi:hypothetical protein
MSRIPFLAVALLGCSGTTTGTPDETGQTGDTGGGLVPPAAHGDCAVDTSTATALPGARQVLLDGYGYGTGVPAGLATQVFADQAAYDAFLAATGSYTGETVDFATELAVAVTYGPGATCGLTLDGWDAWDVAGTPHVEVRVLDGSYGCQTVCDMAADLLVVVAVPRGAAATATACGKVGGGCGEAP